jgi:hypothetical protein
MVGDDEWLAMKVAQNTPYRPRYACWLFRALDRGEAVNVTETEHGQIVWKWAVMENDDVNQPPRLYSIFVTRDYTVTKFTRRAESHEEWQLVKER